MLAFSDTFAAPGGPPDPSKWACCINQEGGGNQELQYYVPEAVSCSPAGLVITASRDNGSYAAQYGPSQFLSGKVWTKGLLEFRYGRLDVTASIPAGQPGAWPAIWLLGANLDENTWPGCGEIDIMESFGVNAQPAVIAGSMHTPADNPTCSYTVPGAPLTSMHTYSLDWRPTSLTWSADGKPYQQVLRKDCRDWVFDLPVFLILNLAVGGTMGGAVPPAAPLPYQMIVRSVALYNAEIS
jgi:beta-glucanase (GH16 family)